MRKTNGFTLIELLVVITIITVLAGLLIPGVLRAMKQAKSNRALSEMQHLSTVITQIYSEVGYYVRLEDLAQPTEGNVRRWLSTDTITSTTGRNDGDIDTDNTLSITTNGANDVHLMWAGPYATYKNYVTATPFTGFAGSRPIDPWGTMGSSDANQHQYRMFWTTAAPLPAGTTGAMVIISAGPDKIYQCGISGSTNPSAAVTANFDDFAPTSTNKGDDVYYIFNAGIQ